MFFVKEGGARPRLITRHQPGGAKVLRRQPSLSLGKETRAESGALRLRLDEKGENISDVGARHREAEGAFAPHRYKGDGSIALQ